MGLLRGREILLRRRQPRLQEQSRLHLATFGPRQPERFAQPELRHPRHQDPVQTGEVLPGRDLLVEAQRDADAARLPQPLTLLGGGGGKLTSAMVMRGWTWMREMNLSAVKCGGGRSRPRPAKQAMYCGADRTDSSAEGEKAPAKGGANGASVLMFDEGCSWMYPLTKRIASERSSTPRAYIEGAEAGDFSQGREILGPLLCGLL
jgi:hypothetical protein